MTARPCSSPIGVLPSPGTLMSNSRSRGLRRATTSRSAGSTTRARPTRPSRRFNNAHFGIDAFSSREPVSTSLENAMHTSRDLPHLGGARAGGAGLRCAAGGRRRYARSRRRGGGVPEILHDQVPQAEAGGFRQRPLFDERGSAPAMGGEGTIPALRILA